VSTLCRFPYSVCRPSCRGGETGQAREFERDLWLLASRRRADAVACVPTIESSLTPAGAAAVDRARTPLDHLRLPQLSCACRDKLWGPTVPGRVESTVHRALACTCTSRTKTPSFLCFATVRTPGKMPPWPMPRVSTRMSSARKVEASLLGFVPQRKLEHAPMLEGRRADDILSRRRPNTLVASEPYPRPASLSLEPP
jgi:hypothetical protein